MPDSPIPPSVSKLTDKLVDLVSGYSIPKIVQVKILLIIANAFILIWACISAIMYVGCLDTPLLCPVSHFRIPFTEVNFGIPSELPLLLLIIIASTVNVTHIVYAEKLHRINTYILAGTATLFLFSNIFIETRVNLEAALIEELRKLGLE